MSSTSFLGRLRESLSRTRERLGDRIGGLLAGRALDDALFDELEEILIAADCGPRASLALVEEVRRRANEEHVRDGAELPRLLSKVACEILLAAGGGGTANDTAGAAAPSAAAGASAAATTSPSPAPATPAPREAAGLRLAAAPPTVVLMAGVNGVGKTTTIGKLAAQLAAGRLSVMLAAGDTFRAAAGEQLQIWAERAGADLVRHAEGADPAAVLYDALAAARARGRDVVIVDTAGRLHTKANLMDELRKMVRVAGREVPGAPHETLLVLDATTGQNGLAQARAFHEALGITGVVLTKLDGTARGGVALAVAKELGLPIRWMGLGEGVSDLRPFDAGAFVAALFAAGPDAERA